MKGTVSPNPALLKNKADRKTAKTEIQTETEKQLGKSMKIGALNKEKQGGAFTKVKVFAKLALF